MLFSTERTHVWLSQTEMATLYNFIIRPAAIAVAPTSKASWPISYSAEMFWTQTATGHHSFGSVPIAAADVFTFGTEIQHRLGQHDWGQQAFFFTDVRGYKDVSRHNAQPRNEPDELFLMRSEVELGNTAIGLDIDVLAGMNSEEERCYVDVGIEVAVPEHAVCWRSDGHQHVLKEIIPDWTDEECQRRTSKHHAHYRQDLLAQFTEVSGFRLTVSMKFSCITDGYISDGVIHSDSLQFDETHTMLFT